MTNLQDVKTKRKSKIELASEGKKSGIVPSFLRFDEKSSSRARKVIMNHGTAQDDQWDATRHPTQHGDQDAMSVQEVEDLDSGPDMNEIMPATHTSSPMRHVDQDAMSVQEVEDLY